MARLYKDPVLEALIERLNADGPVRLKNKYFVGDPVIVGMSSLPMCFISRDTTTVSIDTNIEDRHDIDVVLNLVYSGAPDLNRNFAQAGALALYELVEGRNDNYELRSDSIAGVLRAAQVLDGNNKLYIDVGSGLTIEYVLSPPARRNIFSVEAVIRTRLRNLQVRP